MKLVALFMLSFALMGTGVGYFSIKAAGSSEQTLEKATLIELKSGESLKSLSRRLEALHVVEHGWLFQYWVKLFDRYEAFQSGTYRFVGQVSFSEIATAMRNGDSYEPIVLKVTIPEGFTFAKIRDRLVARGVGTKREFDRLFRDPTLLKKYKIPSRTLEGYLYPATYSFVKKPSAEQALERMLRHFWNSIPPNYERDLKRWKLSLAQAITFASLIELETKYEDEMFIISEVIWTRLKRRDFLGIDAAIPYGIKDYRGDIKRVHLDDATNPYNTRKNKGLPPTPVGSPSKRAMAAVVKPTNTGYYYYVLKAGSDRHHFSYTEKEHQRHVDKLVRYQLKRR